MTGISELTRRLLCFSMLDGVGGSALQKIGSYQAFISETEQDVAQRVKAVEKALQTAGAFEKAQSLAAQQIERCQQDDVRILSRFDPDYPVLLASTRQDPALLYVRGSFHRTPERSVAIIGTRTPTPHGQEITARVTRIFVENGWSVVSGLALGCDRIAHRTALAHKGHTLAVLAHGLHTIAPSQNRRLAEEILEQGGALVSEYPMGRDALPRQFVKRDLIQAGLSQGVAMIQSGRAGGSLHASRAALEYDRLLIVPYPTQLDLENREPVIEANRILARGPADEQCELLGCKPAALRNRLVVRGRDDYPALLQRLDIRASFHMTPRVPE